IRDLIVTGVQTCALPIFREIGKDSYGFMSDAQVRVDPADNIWAVDEMSNMVMKFDPEGRVAMLLGRKAEAEFIPPRPPGGDGARSEERRVGKACRWRWSR